MFYQKLALLTKPLDMKTLVFSLFILLSTHLLVAQSEANFMFPAEYGNIEYEYSGNTEGSRLLYFEESGKRLALYTNLARTSTFYSVRSTTRGKCC